MEKKENMRVYNAVREVPRSAQRAFNNGRFSGTDINPVWRIEKMTELFGPCGEGWYFGEPQFIRAESTVNCVLPLYVKTADGAWSAPVYGVGGNTLVSNKGAVSDEAYKMAYTDAQSNATKLLGVGADIWYDSSETKYTAKADRDSALYGEAVAKIEAAMTERDVAQLINVEYASIKEALRPKCIERVRLLREHAQDENK